MNTVPMMWVLPVTGPEKDRGRTCYVCQLGSAPVIAAFIEPSTTERENYIGYVQRLCEINPALQGFIVILDGPDENLIKDLKTFAIKNEISVPIAVLDPEVGLPSGVPVSSKENLTILLYRGRFFEKKITISPDGSTKLTTFSGNESPTEVILPKVVQNESSFEFEGFSPPFYEIHKAANAMINRD